MSASVVYIALCTLNIFGHLKGHVVVLQPLDPRIVTATLLAPALHYYTFIKEHTMHQYIFFSFNNMQFSV